MKISLYDMLNRHRVAITFLLLVSFSILAFELVYSEPFNFGNPQNLSNGNLQDSQFVEIASFGPNVFVTWMNVTSNNQIYFTKSTNNGTSFSTPVELTGGIDSIRDPKITTNNNDNVYVSWIDDTNFIPEIITSTNNGTSFGSVIDIGTDLGNFVPDQVRLAANNDTAVYVVWLDDDGLTNIETFLRQSTDNGATFGSTITVSNGDAFAGSPQVITNGATNVYVVWQNDPLFNGFDDIFFSASTDSGSSFTVNEFTLSDSSNPAQLPQIATGNTTNVYVTWQQHDGIREQVLFSSSTNNGTSFDISQVSISNSTGITGSTSPQIAASGNNVYVVWQDDSDGDNDIYFRSSANNGTSFTPALATLPLNISSNTGDSINPKIAASGDNVFIVWQDDSFGSTEILFASSTDKGITFGNPVRLTNTPTTGSNLPNVAATSNFAHVVWEEGDSGDIQAFYSTGVPPTVSFNATTFRTYDAGTISITSSSSNTDSATSQTIIAQVISDSDPTGISLVLTETDIDTGIFEASIDFTSGTSSGTTLQVVPGDVITATFDGSSATASISPIVVSFGNLSYTLGDSAIITITDQNSNVTASIETITGTITSTTFPGGISLSFTETGAKTGIFQNTDLIFMTGNDLFSFTDNIKISQFEDAGGQTTDNTITTLQVDVDSTTAPGIGLDNLVLTETGQNTGQFEETITFTSSASSGTSLQAATGDIISVTYNGETSNGLITPTAATIGGIQASIGDTITASFGVGSDTADIIPGAGGGGGGGGLIRPGLVVDAVGAIALLGGGSGASGPPSFDDTSFTLSKGFGGVLSDSTLPDDATSKLEVGKKSDISMGFKMPGGLNYLDHIGLYANIGAGQGKYDSDTYIYFDKYKIPQITIHDPHGFFKSVNIDVTEPTQSNLDVNFVFDFAKSLDNSNVVFEAWNIKRESALKEIPNLLNVNDPTKPEVLSETQTIQPTTQERPLVPDWLKSNAAWWGKGEIDDKEFTNGIGYLIQKQIIDIPELLQKNTSPEKRDPDTGVMEEPDEFTPIVPAWVKNNAIWWSEGQLTDDDFLIGIKYLLEKGIIQVKV